MAGPLLVSVFALVASVAFGQDAVPVKAGDRAPEIDWSKTVQSPESKKYQHWRAASHERRLVKTSRRPLASEM
jgi:hypothetical protein